MTQPIVIAVGAGRCGTRTIAKQAQALGANAYHEPEPLLTEVAAKAYSNLGSLKVLSAEMQAHRAELLERAEMADRVYFEASLWWTWLLPVVSYLWPQTKVIWLERQLVSWAKSAFRRGWYHPQVEREMVNYRGLRPEPSSGWPDDRLVDRWFKLGWLYQTVERRIARGLSVTGLEFVRFPCEQLSDLGYMELVLHWAGLTGKGLKEPIVANSGDVYITIRELQAIYKPKTVANAHEYSRVLREDVEKKFGVKLDPTPDLDPLDDSILASLAAGERFALRTSPDEALRPPLQGG